MGCGQSKPSSGGSAKRRRKSSSHGETSSPKRRGKSADAKPAKSKNNKEAPPVIDFTAVWKDPAPPSILKNGSSGAASFREEGLTDGVFNPLSPIAGDPMAAGASPQPRARKVTLTPETAAKADRDQSAAESPAMGTDVSHGTFGASSIRSFGALPPPSRRHTLSGSSSNIVVAAADSQQAMQQSTATPNAAGSGASEGALGLAPLSSSGRRSDGGEKPSSSGFDDLSIATGRPAPAAKDKPKDIGFLVIDDTQNRYAPAAGSSTSVNNESWRPAGSRSSSLLVASAGPISKTGATAPVAKAAPTAGPILTISGKQYNFAKLLSSHPGGAGILKKYDGKDATSEFMSSHYPPPLHALPKYAMAPVEL